MDLSLYNWGDISFSALFAAFLALVVFLFFSVITSALDEARTDQLRESSGTFGELYINLPPEIFLVLRAIWTVFLFSIGFIAVRDPIGSFVAGGLLGALGWLGPGLILKQLRWKRVKLCEKQLVEGLELMGNSIKSGLTLPQAVELLVKEFPPPINQEFKMLLAETRLGVEFNDGLRHIAERLNSTIFAILATGVAITKQCGGDMTIIFANIAQTIREQATIEGKLDAVTAQARFQGLILSLMPFALVVILWFVDRTHVETLFGYTLGLWAIALVIIMVVMAQMWIRKLLAIDV